MLVLAWAVGLGLCAVAASIVIYMGVRGLQYLFPSLIFSLEGQRRPGRVRRVSRPAAGDAAADADRDPRRGADRDLRRHLDRRVRAARVACTDRESSIEVVAGTPDIVIALFGLAIFQLGLFAPLSFTSENGGVYGKSFLTAGIMMSLLALPPVFAATRDGLQTVPAHMREAAYALGKTKATTIRRVVLPRVRSHIGTGVTLGMSRIIGDTAIVLLLCGATLRIETQGGVPGLNVLRGTGASLTTFVYDKSRPGKARHPKRPTRPRSCC